LGNAILQWRKGYLISVDSPYLYRTEPAHKQLLSNFLLEVLLRPRVKRRSLFEFRCFIGANLALLSEISFMDSPFISRVFH
jgi:hypothetical protein